MAKSREMQEVRGLEVACRVGLDIWQTRPGRKREESVNGATKGI